MKLMNEYENQFRKSSESDLLIVVNSFALRVSRFYLLMIDVIIYK